MRVALTLVVVWLLSAIAATLLFVRKGALEVKCVWFVLIAALPVAGALLYLLAATPVNDEGVLKVNAPQACGLYKAANKACGTAGAEYESAEYFTTGTDFLRAALEAVKKAKKSVYIEFYIIGRGHVFNAFLEEMRSAAARGVEIKIILDGMGSAFRLNGKDIKKLKEAGAEVKIFNRLTPVPHSRINRRDHRKILTVDGKIAFTGGVNLADEYANINRPYGYWKDTGVAVHGRAAEIFEGMFLAMWFGKYEMPAPPLGKKNCLPFCDSPPDKKFAEELYISAISSATRRVHILTPYLCLSDKTASALAFTARRGVEVKIIIPHIPDKKYAFEVSKAFAFMLKRYGVELYEYTPGFLHAKAVICDDRVFLGSYNFDFRSTHFNYECGVAFEDEVCDEVERDFQSCLALSTKITDGKPSKLKRLYRFLLRFFAPLI